MAFQDPWLAEGKESPLDFERQLFERTGNAICAWRGYEICSELMRAGQINGLPVWILDYLDRFTEEVRELFYAGMENTPPPAHAVAARVMAALGLKEIGNSPSTAFSRIHRDRDERSLACMVWQRKLKTPDASLEAIIADLSMEFSERAALFEQLKESGRLDASAIASVHERRHSEKKIWNAWSRWKDHYSKKSAQDRAVT
jgi:hypothetical protein